MKKYEDKLRINDKSQELSDKMDKGLFIYVVVLLLIIVGGFLLFFHPMEQKEQLLFMLPAVFMILIVIFLIAFFNKQYVNITEINSNVVFDKYNGSRSFVRIEEIEYIEDTYSFYYIYLKSGKKLSAFKLLMVPDRSVHRDKLKKQIEHLESLGVKVQRNLK